MNKVVQIGSECSYYTTHEDKIGYFQAFLIQNGNLYAVLINEKGNALAVPASDIRFKTKDMP